MPLNDVSFTSRTRTQMHSRRKHKNNAHCFLYKLKTSVCGHSYYNGISVFLYMYMFLKQIVQIQENAIKLQVTFH